MTSLRFGLSMCVAGFLAAGCPAEDGEDEGNDDVSMTSAPGSESGGASSGEPADSGSGMVPSDLSHATDIQPIWDTHCVDACHEPDGEWGFLLDMSGDAYDDIVGVMAPQLSSMPHIDPDGDPENSYIWRKINNTQAAAGGSGLQMPKAPTGGTASMLTQAELDTIEEWIIAGAPE